MKEILKYAGIVVVSVVATLLVNNVLLTQVVKIGAISASEASHLSQEPKPTALGNTYISGDLEVDSVIYAGSGLNVYGDSRLSSLVKTGSIATFTTTSYATTANVCDNPVWSSASNGSATTTITLPATTTLFADCLTANGDSVDLVVINTDSSLSTVLAAGNGGTALYESSLTIAAGKAATVKVVRDSATTYKMLVVSLDN